MSVCNEYNLPGSCGPEREEPEAEVSQPSDGLKTSFLMLTEAKKREAEDPLKAKEMDVILAKTTVTAEISGIRSNHI